MKHIIITTIAAVLVVGCGEAQQPVPSPEAKPVEPVADAAKPEGQPEPTTAKAPDISIWDAAADGNTEAVKQHLAAGVDVNAKDEGGKTPLDRASEAAPLNRAMTTETAALLRKHGGKTGEELKLVINKR